MPHIANRFVTVFFSLVLTTLASAQDLTADMAAWVSSQDMATSNLAIATMVIDGDETTHFAVGRTAPDAEAPDRATQFQIGSISKVFTDLLLAEVVADGKVSYKTTIGELLGADFSPSNPAVAEITLLQLATHTSGLPRLPPNLTPGDPLDPYRGYDAQRLLAGLQQTRAKQPLHDQYAYSNFGVGLLGYLLGRVHGDGYAAALADYVIEPLGLRQTGVSDSANQAQGFRAGEVVPAWTFADALAGAGALWSTTEDLAQLAQVLLAEAPAELAHALADDLRIEAQTRDGFAVTRVWHVSYDGEQPVYWHNGGTGGFWSFFGFRPESGQAVAILVSGDTNPTDAGLQLLGAQAMPPRPDVIDAQVLGQYRFAPQFGIGVFEQNGRLMAQATGQPSFPLLEMEDDWYALHVVDASLKFTREDGVVTGVQLAQGGLLQAAAKVADVATSQQRDEVTLAADVLAAFVGDYALSPAVSFSVRQREGGLEVKLTGQPFLPVYAGGEDVFFYKAVDAELHFERDEKGVVNALVLHQGGFEQRAEKR